MVKNLFPSTCLDICISIRNFYLKKQSLYQVLTCKTRDVKGSVTVCVCVCVYTTESVTSLVEDLIV